MMGFLARLFRLNCTACDLDDVSRRDRGAPSQLRKDALGELLRDASNSGVSPEVFLRIL